MAHGLGFAFVDFLDGDPRGIVPPVYAPLLQSNGSAMLIDGIPSRLFVQLATAVTNSSAAARQLTSMPPHTLLWLRKGRAAFSDPESGCKQTANDEVCFAALWLRERFWRAVMARQARIRALADASSTGQQTRLQKRTNGFGTDVSALLSTASPTSTSEGGPIRICVHVRRGDVYYLGPKTRKPHPHWVETMTVLDVLAGARRALGIALEEPAVRVDVFTEKGWLRNDTLALHAIAPNAMVHLDSSPKATVGALVQMSQADLLIMGSSGFSFWAGIFSCGVKVGYLREEAEPLPMRFVKYATTITTHTAPFWPSAGRQLRSAWADYWSCRRDPTCRPSLCQPKHMSPGLTHMGSVWTRSVLARQQLTDTQAVQWQLPELVLWPRYESSKQRLASLSPPSAEGPALRELRATCAPKALERASRAPGGLASAIGRRDAHDYGIDGCLRNSWLHNLTQFLAARKKAGVISVG